MSSSTFVIVSSEGMSDTVTVRGSVMGEIDATAKVTGAKAIAVIAKLMGVAPTEQKVENGHEGQ